MSIGGPFDTRPPRHYEELEWDFAPETTFEKNYRTWHTYLSLGKSATRMLTCVVAYIIPTLAIEVLCVGMFLAECIGIIEEL